MRATDRNRRRVLRGVAAAATTGLGGCLGLDGGDSTATEGEDAATTDETGDAAAAGGATTTAAEDLDLRETNVVNVAFEPTDDGYRFDVTLYHDDDAEEGYADWWQIETLPGETLGRRKFRRAHGTEPFTRSKTVSVPDDVECVLVRGHDQTHAYGGRVVILDLSTGARRAVRQGSNQESFVDHEC